MDAEYHAAAPEKSPPAAASAADAGRGEWAGHWRYFAVIAALGAALRLFFVLRFPFLTPDSLIYGDIAKNWLHGVYGLSGAAGPEPTYIRLPGYPAVLAVLFRLFGVDHYAPVLWLQAMVDVAACFVVADLARRLVSPRAGRIAFALAALCPFLANYTAVALTETFAIFFAALTFDLAVAALDASASEAANYLHLWSWCGLAIAASILLRPDGGMLLIIVGGALLLRWFRRHKQRRTTALALLTLTLASLLPLLPWTVRNWRTFHQIQPLVPFGANSPDEYLPTGFARWTRTWMVDYASVEDIAWQPDGGRLDINLVPARAFHDELERQRVSSLFDAYNQTLTMSPALDRQFADVADQRIARNRLLYYVLLPLARSLDMWLRPRTEMLPITPHWWWFDDPRQDAWAIAFGVVGFFYAGAALWGLLRARRMPYLPMLLAYVVFRTLFIACTESPEPRYVLECFPVMLLLAAAPFPRQRSRIQHGGH